MDCFVSSVFFDITAVVMNVSEPQAASGERVFVSVLDPFTVFLYDFEQHMLEWLQLLMTLDKNVCKKKNDSCLENI